jgi:hypothetical protein
MDVFMAKETSTTKKLSFLDRFLIAHAPFAHLK